MSCETEQAAFKARLDELQGELDAELAAIQIETERRAAGIAADFEAGNDLSEGIGAAAGVTIGGVAAGAPGAAAGAVVGKTIGALFTLEISTRRQTVSLDAPQVAIQTRTLSFDVPEVRVDDRDITIGVPTLESRRIPGPPEPVTIVEMVTKCVGTRPFRVCTKVPEVTIRWKDTWIDVPVPVVKPVTFTIGLPTVDLVRRDLSFDVPQISIRRVEFSFDVPYIAIRFIKDAGRRTAALAAALAQSAQEQSLKKQIEFNSRLRTEVVPLALAMLDCFRAGIASQRAAAGAPFDAEIAKLSAVVAAISSRGAEESDQELVRAKSELERVLLLQAKALKPFDDALAEFDRQAKETIARLLSEESVAESFVEGDALTGEGVGSSLHTLISYSSGR